MKGLVVSLSFGIAVVLGVRVYLLETSLGQVQDALDHEKEKRKSERAGRITAEKKLRDKVITSGVSYTPIAVIRTPYPDRRGTPRQGNLVPTSQACIEFASFAQPVNSLRGLDDYSHLWIIGIFHGNTNLGKQDADTSRTCVKALVKPPRLAGVKTGLFSTRSPHRFNPISLSLVRIESIDLNKGCVWVSGSDLIDGTPILDVKPYIPGYDYIPDQEVHIADWVGQGDESYSFSHVTISEKDRDQIQKDVAGGKSKCFKPLDSEKAVEACLQMLSLDHRSNYRRDMEFGEFQVKFDIWTFDCKIHIATSEVSVMLHK